MVTTVTVIFKTFIPQGKSNNWPAKALWNKGLIFIVYKPYRKPIKLVESLYFIIFCYIFLFFAIFFYIFSVAHMKTFRNNPG